MRPPERLTSRLTPRLPPRLIGAVLVIVLHVPLVLGLLTMNLAPGIRRLVTEREASIEMVLPPWPQAKKSTAPVQGPDRSGTGTVVSPDTLGPYFSPPASAPSVGELAFGCAPENLRNLPREQQQKCLKLASGRYLAMKDGVPVSIKLPGPEWEGLRNSDIRARERGTADPCMAAKATGTDCIHEVLYGKKLW